MESININKYVAFNLFVSTFTIEIQNRSDIIDPHFSLLHREI